MLHWTNFSKYCLPWWSLDVNERENELWKRALNSSSRAVTTDFVTHRHGVVDALVVAVPVEWWRDGGDQEAAADRVPAPAGLRARAAGQPAVRVEGRAWQTLQALPLRRQGLLHVPAHEWQGEITSRSYVTQAQPFINLRMSDKVR